MVSSLRFASSHNYDWIIIRITYFLVNKCKLEGQYKIIWAWIGIWIKIFLRACRLVINMPCALFFYSSSFISTLRPKIIPSNFFITRLKPPILCWITTWHPRAHQRPPRLLSNLPQHWSTNDLLPSTKITYQASFKSDTDPPCQLYGPCCDCNEDNWFWVTKTFVYYSLI